MTINAFVRDGNGWRQYGIMELATFEKSMESGKTRIVATDMAGKLVAWSDERDAPKGA